MATKVDVECGQHNRNKRSRSNLASYATRVGWFPAYSAGFRHSVAALLRLLVRLLQKGLTGAFLIATGDFRVR